MAGSEPFYITSQKPISNTQLLQPETESFNEMLVTGFLHLLQQLVNTAKKGGVVTDKASFHETCSQLKPFLFMTW